MALLHSFPALLGDTPRVLILGSMPGAASLRAGEYYAHRQNRFWTLMGTLVGATPELDYGPRCARLTSAGIALWDVLAHCEREGSLDSAIRDDTAGPNDFASLFTRHPTIGTVLFNGAKAETSFVKLVAPLLASEPDIASLQRRRLPSTSPANASQSVEHKLATWREALRWGGIKTI